MAQETPLSADAWDVDVVKSMFAASAGPNIDKYFKIIDPALDKAIGAVPNNIPAGPAGDLLRLHEQQRLQLKLYAFATIAVENAGMRCADEGVSDFNTLNARASKSMLAVHSEAPITGWNLPLGDLAMPWWAREQPKWVEMPFGHPWDVTRAFGKYDYRKKALGNNGYGMGEMYKGRGFVQLTGLNNYVAYGFAIGLPDLYLRPQKASEPEIAAAILAQYILANKHAILKALGARDFPAARRVVNGPKALHWEKLKKAYETGEEQLKEDAPAPTPSPSLPPGLRMTRT